jgi:hypothetical protein
LAAQLSSARTSMELPLVAGEPFLNELMMKMCDETMAVRSTNVG